jgi:DNA-binding beta-propeller fold protein YncE
MRTHSFLAAAMLTFALAGLLVAVPLASPPEAPPPKRLLPGPRADGFIQLPNQWRLRPAGRQTEVGDFPVHLVLHPGGKFLAALHAGYTQHEIIVLSLAANQARVVSRTILDQTFYGLAFAPDGGTLYASGGEYEIVHAFDFRDGLLGNHRRLRVSPARNTFVVSGVAVSPDGQTVYAAGLLGNALVAVPAAGGEPRRVTFGQPPGEGERPTDVGPDDDAEPLPVTRKGALPYAILPSPDGRRLFVSLWNHAAVAVVDPATMAVTARWPTASHPTEMALRADGKALYVACANSTLVSVLDGQTGQPLQTLNCALYPQAPSGNTPASLALSPDGALLFVANADNNNIAMFNTSDAARAVPLGFIPVGWYPTSVRFAAADRKIFVANGKGILPRANRPGPNPGMSLATAEYIAGIHRGTLSAIDLPDPPAMARYTQTAQRCSPLRSDNLPVAVPEPGGPIPARPGDPSPIKYCIYVIKENRTYDQVFGDMKEGNGDEHICLFPEAVTPNHHAIAREFVLLDNFYVESEVSADGHEWSMAAYATDFVEKVWPLVYRSPKANKLTYPAEGAFDHMARPAGGYIWDRAKEAGVSYRSYGEWVRNGKTPDDPGTATVPALEGHFDPHFRSYDLDYTDQKRADRFIAELKRFEAEGEMPRLQIVRLPNDHTAGARAGKPTPTVMVADNDLALGRVMEAVSNSKFWPQTAVFVIEDDAQNGPDHVDAHRVVALVASPYCRRGVVDSNLYSTSSMLRTMELILGLQPMSQFDAAARPMYASFQKTPDLRPYTPRQPKVDWEARNPGAGLGARLSEGLDLTKEDAADDILFNRIIWHAVKGPDVPMPAPVRAAFVRPKGDD